MITIMIAQLVLVVTAVTPGRFPFCEVTSYLCLIHLFMKLHHKLNVMTGNSVHQEEYRFLKPLKG